MNRFVFIDRKQMARRISLRATRRIMSFSSKEVSAPCQREYRTHADKAAVAAAKADVLGACYGD